MIMAHMFMSATSNVAHMENGKIGFIFQVAHDVGLCYTELYYRWLPSTNARARSART